MITLKHDPGNIKPLINLCIVWKANRRSVVLAAYCGLGGQNSYQAGPWRTDEIDTKGTHA